MSHRLGVTGMLTATLVLGAAIASAAPSDEDGHQPLTNDHAYVFNQQLRDNIGWWNDSWMPQTVPDGAHIQIQLPSDPVQWTPDTGDTCQPSSTLGVNLDQLGRSRVELLGSSALPDDGRITGSSAIAVFDYRVTGTGVAALCLRPQPADADPDVLGFPPGTPPFYALTVLVGVPQANIS